MKRSVFVLVAVDSTGALPQSRRVLCGPSPAVPAGGVFQHGDVMPVSTDVPHCCSPHQQVHLPPDRRRPPAAAEILGHQTDHEATG